MKALVKRGVPPILQQNGETWTSEYVRGVAAGERPRGHWGHSEIRDELHQETFGRCAYCEARVGHVAHEHVEHIRPKAIFPELAHEWMNLTAACPVCNTNKGPYYSETHPLLNPYVDDPERHIAFVGSLPWACNGSEIGYRSIKKLGLDRMQLVSDRANRLLNVLNLFHAWQSAVGGTREALRDALIADCEEGEYPTAVRSLLASVGFAVDESRSHHSDEESMPSEIPGSIRT